jgi:hypothetical protein
MVPVLPELYGQNNILSLLHWQSRSGVLSWKRMWAIIQLRNDIRYRTSVSNHLTHFFFCIYLCPVESGVLHAG